MSAIVGESGIVVTVVVVFASVLVDLNDVSCGFFVTGDLIVRTALSGLALHSWRSCGPAAVVLGSPRRPVRRDWR